MKKLAIFFILILCINGILFSQIFDENDITISGHNGIHLGASLGMRVNAVMDGIVMIANTDPMHQSHYGKFIVIKHLDGTSTLYACLKDVFVSKGQEVIVGQHIGNAGSTGKRLKPEFHFGYDGNGDGIFSRVNPADDPAKWLFQHMGIKL